MQAERARGHTHNCKAGHRFDSGDPSTHYVTAKGQVRYVCPTCMAKPGWKLPRGWTKAGLPAKAAPTPARSAPTTAYWPF